MPGALLPGAVRALTDSVLRFVEANPPAAAGLAVLALVVFGGGVYRLVRSRRAAGLKLKRVLSGRDRVAVLMHPNPDPDAMATAMGVELLAADLGVETDLRYPGEIRHQENRAFRTVLDVQVDPIETAADLPEDVVLVDHNTARGFDGASDIDPIAVIDHHPGDGTGRRFTDVRPEYGAAATILVEYLQAAGFEPATEDAERPLPTEVATGLLYGVLSDTDHLTRGCSEAEFDASAFLYPAIDEDTLDRVAHPEVDAEVLDVKARAIESREVQGPFAVSDVGELSNVDAIPQAADELLNLEGVTAVVVMGQKNGTLHLSGRSRDDRVHMGRALQEAVADIPMAGAGGHSRMGGGQLSIEHMNGLGPSDGVSSAEFSDRLFAVLGGEQ
ncbi:DHH family phosphoesterase [Halodesulfurarchaeum formicicum]|uniref:Phosphoesterase RecJ domain-containing protein n=1 Tax=Halodesulfurarchaeum formicicum TaxID=1873524 RepID=A0A1J1ADT1_9EURY|nr:DHHA1 domain-containing protein [Halodesulfurarchaeum formicicum]APE96300.1 phosphoesterase RecJ domain-containing protein [Halodesulfurarchaeum formicicum]